MQAEHIPLMEKKQDRYRTWWLYGAAASFLVAVAGAVLMFFFHPDKNVNADDDSNNDRTETVHQRHGHWFQRNR